MLQRPSDRKLLNLHREGEVEDARGLNLSHHSPMVAGYELLRYGADPGIYPGIREL
jgi:hypothetical protein